ncbi:Acid beta-fructofuranosidase [Hordeum vulgare]|nr:Acid beta-fructofuranosidase [Hordeum vulgare]
MKEKMLSKHWGAKVAMVKNRGKRKEEKWENRCDFEERKITLEEQKRKDERAAEEDQFMMMNPEGMDASARVFGN